MSESRRSIGARGEAAAEKFLRSKGLKIIRRGYRCRQGEVDIIARDKDVLCFIEVKTRGDKSFGEAIESITERKISRIAFAAIHFLSRYKISGVPVRFDVLLVDSSDPQMKIEHIENAFDSPFPI